MSSLSIKAPPEVAARAAQDIAQQHYGIAATAERLGGERDANFLLRGEDGRRYVLKFSGPDEPPPVTNLCTEALLHIARRDPGLPVQRVLPALDGRHEPRLDPGLGAPLTVRLFSWLDGVPQYQAPGGPAQRAAVGRLLARTDLALAGFTHPVLDGYELLWDIQLLDRLHPMADAIEDAAQRALVEAVFAREADYVAPRRARLRAQVIHNDLNPHNLLIDPADSGTVAGILDFGDMVRGPLVQDLAVACSYHAARDEGGHPLQAVSEVVAAYHAQSPLLPEELDVLFDLVQARLAATVVITGWRARRYPQHRDYILRNNPISWAGLQRLSGLAPEAARGYLANACRIG